MPVHPTYLIVLPWDILPWDPRSAGGVNEVARNLLRSIRADGTWRPALLVASWSHRSPVVSEDERALTIRARLRDPFSRADSVRSLVRSLCAMPRTVLRLGRILSRHGVGVVNLHYASPHVWTFLVLRRLVRRPFRILVSFHGLDVQAIRDASPLARRTWSRVLGRCDALVCCSDALARELAETLPTVRERIAVVHNGIDPESTLEDVAPAPLPAPLVGRRYLACVATFEHKKGLDVLVRAFARLAPSEPDLDLAIVGREEVEHAPIEVLVDSLGLRGRIHILNDVPHPIALRVIRSARAFVLPSRREPFGIVLLEAGLFGVPIVATRVGGIPEVVLDGETGRLVPPDDEAALASALAAAAREDDETRRMASAMHERVIQVFSWDAAFAKYRALALGEMSASPEAWAEGWGAAGGPPA